MRPVNLIPPDARRGDRAPMRVGSVSYIVIGALAAALLGAIALGFTGKQVSDRKAEVAELTQQQQQVTAQAQSLQSFVDFRSVQETRAATVASLAQSRFDWDRVLNELARVIPANVWLTQLTGTVSPSVQIDGGADVPTRDSVNGPALEVVGCATSQDEVAGFVSDLEDIDGVTRVGVSSSKLPDSSSGSGAAATGATVSSGSDDTSDDCRTRDFIARFELVVAFDAVPVPDTASSAPGVPAPATTPSGSTPASAPTQPSAEAASASQAASQTKKATDIIPGG
jgi:Tfp pilus assembly protein PilN